MYNQNVLETVALISFLVDVANYRENLTQNDKDDIMQKLDKQTTDILQKVEDALEEQNAMLQEILERLGG